MLFVLRWDCGVGRCSVSRLRSRVGVGGKKEEHFDEGLLGPKERSGKEVYAMGPRVARLDEEMCEFDKKGVQELQILDPDTGKGILAGDHERRFFEASWMHVYERKYYFSYSTGDTHNICYAGGRWGRWARSHIEECCWDR